MQRSLDALAVLRFILEPAVYRTCILELRKRPAEPGCQPGFESGAVQARRFVGLDFVHGAALHEQALYRVQRREFRVARRQRLRLGLDAEQCRDEVLQMRRERDQQLRFRLLRQRIGLGARGDQTFGQGRIALFQVFQERRIDARKPCARIQVGKGEAEIEHRWTCETEKNAMLPWPAAAAPNVFLFAYARAAWVAGGWI